MLLGVAQAWIDISRIIVKIVILDGYTANPGDLSWNEMERLGDVTVYDRTSPGETVARALEADIVLTNKVILGRQEILQLPCLKYIGVLATGYNVVDIEAARESGITVTNVPAYSTMSVAQMVFAHLLTVTNHVEHSASEGRQGRWSRNLDFCYWDAPLTELAGKTFGIIGLGNIGTQVAMIAHAFGMRVVAYTSKPEKDIPYFVEKRTLPALLAESDVISLHCPLTPDTRHLINSQSVRTMKPTAILINTGRGPLVDDQAVANALADGTIAAYCADVMTQEPPDSDNPLFRQPHAFITPHIAWASTEARIRLIQVATDNVRGFIDGKPQNVVS